MDPWITVERPEIEGILFSQSRGTIFHEKLRRKLSEIHHLYLTVSLAATPRGAPEEHHSSVAFLRDAAYDMLRYCLRRDEGLTEDEKSNAFALAGYVFELLSKLSSDEPDSMRQLLTLAAISNSLAFFEANAAVLARRIVGDSSSPTFSLAHAREQSGMPSNLDLLPLLLLSRAFALIRSLSTVLRAELATADDTMRSRVNTGILTDTQSAREASRIGLARAVLQTTEFMLSGRVEDRDESLSHLEYAKANALASDDPETYWTVVLFDEAVRHMLSRSIWTALSSLPRTYLEGITTGSDPVVELWSSQLRALRVGAEEGFTGLLDPALRRVAIGMPTSAGKTLLAEFSIVAALTEATDAEARPPICIYVAPTRALVAEVISKLHGHLVQSGISVTGLVGAFDDSTYWDDLFETVGARVLVMTQERLSALIAQHPELLEQCRLFVFDEAHLTSEGARGWVLEATISWVSNLSPETASAKMLFISAAMRPDELFLSWISDGARHSKAEAFTDWRPTRQLLGVCHFPTPPWPSQFPNEHNGVKRWRASGTLSYVSKREDISLDPVRSIEGVATCELVSEYVTERNHSRWKWKAGDSTGCVSHASQLVSRLGALGPTLVYFPKVDQLRQFTDAMGELLQPGVYSGDEELAAYLGLALGANYPLTRAVRNGFAYHHAKLPRDVRYEIELAFRERRVQVLATTTTLAEGVNLPASNLVVADTGIPFVDYGGLSQEKFLNIVGRAGRAMLETEGMVVFMENPNPLERAEKWQDYLFPASGLLTARSAFASDEKLVDLLETSLPRVTSQSISNITADGLGRGAKFRTVAELLRMMQTFVLAGLTLPNAPTTDPDAFADFLLSKTLLGRSPLGDYGDLLRSFMIQTTTDLTTRLSRNQLSAFRQTSLPATANEVLSEIATAFISRFEPFNDFDAQMVVNWLVPQLADCCPELTPEPIRRASGNARIVPIDHAAVTWKWIEEGSSLPEIAERYFADVIDPNLRIERAVQYVSDFFDYRLPWALSAFTLMLEHQVRESNLESEFEDSRFKRYLLALPAYVRFGVHSPPAAFLSIAGLQSRRCARALAESYDGPSRPETGFS